ncbi:uncharacterized protein LOC112494904 [Cephus cinctus]|uniref:Uncharacterized protein LOC112494904 n=1 Tax=Cephus cinctus TaxID=211228 RepID=A0AAJ7RNW0_CEPCN|nr:uncharacterized protein LOC112494904 [Cephus cinctus]
MSCGCQGPDPNVPYSSYEISPPEGGRLYNRQPLDPYGGGARRQLVYDDDEVSAPNSLGRPRDPTGSLYSRRERSRLGPIRGVGNRPDLAELTGVAIARRRLSFDNISDMEDDDVEEPVQVDRRRRANLPSQPAPQCLAGQPDMAMIRQRQRKARNTSEGAPRMSYVTKGGGRVMRM